MPGRLRRIAARFTDSIFKKTFLYIFSLTAASLILLSVTLIALINVSAMRRTDQQMELLAGQMASSMNSYVDTMKETLFMLGQERSLPDIVANEFEDNRSRYTALAAYYNHAGTLIRYKNYVQLFLLVPSRGVVITSEATQYGVDIESLGEPGWLDEIEASRTYFTCLTEFSPPVPLRDALGFALAAPLSRVSDGYFSQKAYLVMTTGRINFRYAIPQEELNDGFYLIRSQDGSVIYQSRGGDPLDEALAAQIARMPFGDDRHHQVEYQGATLRTSQAPIKSLSWELIYCSAAPHMPDADRQTVQFVLIVTAVIILNAALIATYFTRSMMRPIRRIAGAVRSMAEHNFSARIQPVGNDELGRLSADINDMAERIHQLIHQVYEGEIMRKDAQLLALERQINPHFLYNTLEIINALANRGDRAGIRQVVQMLTALFRYSADRSDGGVVTVGRELQYALYYMAIQQTRFQGRIAFEHAVDRDVLDCPSPKFILQPVLENAVTHGLYGADGADGLVTLTGGRDGDDVCLVVRDNGVGMDRETLARLRARLAPGEERPGGIGMANVNARIRLKYGAGYGLTVDSAPGEGTTVRIRLPAGPAQGQTQGEG
ncbi:MAG: histidine kinase [Clostridiales bacterium]|nr:histidine kinase [Clostridiales bacterium]